MSAGGRAHRTGLRREALQSGGLPNGGGAQARAPGARACAWRQDPRAGADGKRVWPRAPFRLGQSDRRSGGTSSPPPPHPHPTPRQVRRRVERPARPPEVTCPRSAPGPSRAPAGSGGLLAVLAPLAEREPARRCSCQAPAWDPGLVAPNREGPARGGGLRFRFAGGKRG